MSNLKVGEGDIHLVLGPGQVQSMKVVWEWTDMIVLWEGNMIEMMGTGQVVGPGQSIETMGTGQVVGPGQSIETMGTGQAVGPGHREE
jgi:hypothetical protein